MLARIRQDFGIGGMVRGLDGDHRSAQRCVLGFEECRELLLGLRRADHQNLVRTGECLRNFIEKPVIRGRLVAAVRALAAVHPLMLLMCMDDAVGLFRGGELPDGRLLMIDPNDGMIV